MAVTNTQPPSTTREDGLDASIRPARDGVATLRRAEMDDAALLAAVADGDRGALEQLYRRHSGWLLARLDRRCADPELTDVAIQDTFLAVWKSASRYRGDGAVGAWLWGIAVRRLIDLTRKRRPIPVEIIHEGATPSAEDRILGRELGPEMAAAMERLTPELRSVMVLTAVDGLTTKETAALLGIPRGTVKTRMMRARKLLTEELR